MSEPAPGDTIVLRLVGGALSTQSLADLALIAGEHADGHLYLTDRAGIELRGLTPDGSEGLVDAIKAAGLLPSPSHELVRNIMVSPFSGRVGGQADLRPVATQLDEQLCDDPDLADLGETFLFVLDDGRGDLVDVDLDVGVMAVDEGAAQVRVGAEQWGEVIELDAVPGVLLDLARPDTPTLALNHARDLRTQVASLPAPYGLITQDDGLRLEHVEIPHGDLTHDLATQVLARAGQDVVVTPWHSLLLVDLEAP